MNQAQQNEADFAYFAAVVDARCSLCALSGRRLELTVRLNKHQLAFVPKLAVELGFKVTRIRDGWYSAIVFLDAEVGRVFAQIHPHIRSARCKRYAQLAFRFWRTAGKRGVKLSYYDRKARQEIISDLKKLNAAEAR